MASVMNEEAELGAYCERLTVGHVGPMADQYRVGGIPFLRSQDIKPFSIQTEGIKFIDEEFDYKLRKSKLRSGDVVIVRTGYPGTNHNPKPFIWTADPDAIIEKVRRGKQALESIH